MQSTWNAKSGGRSVLNGFYCWKFTVYFDNLGCPKHPLGLGRMEMWFVELGGDALVSRVQLWFSWGDRPPGFANRVINCPGSGFEVCCDGPGDVDVAHGAGLETSQGDVVQMCYCTQTKLVQSGGLKKLQGKKVPG